MTVTLKDLKTGQSGTVSKVNGMGAVRKRLLDMGVTKGVTVNVKKVAPLGDPLVINLRGYMLSIRKADAEMVELA